MKCCGCVLRGLSGLKQIWGMKGGQVRRTKGSERCFNTCTYLVQKVWLIWIDYSLAYFSESLSNTFSNTV